MNVGSFCNLFANANNPVVRVWGVITGPIRPYFQRLQQSQFWLVNIHPLHDRYIRPLTTSEKSGLLFIGVLALAIPFIARRLSGPAATPLALVASSALIFVCGKVIQNRAVLARNYPIVVQMAAVVEAVRNTTSRSPYPQLLDIFNTHLKHTDNSHLADEARNYENYRKSFADALGRAPLATLKTQLYNYLEPMVNAPAPLGVRCTELRNAVNRLGTPTQDIDLFQRTYSQWLAIPAGEQNAARAPEITRLRDAITAVIGQPTFVTCRQNLLEFLGGLQSRLERRMPLREILLPILQNQTGRVNYPPAVPDVP